MADAPRKHYAPGDSPADRKRRAERYQREFDEQRRKSPIYAFYQSAQWRQLRLVVLRRYPVCVFCGEKAKHVDHITPIRQDWSRRLDITNLRPLCHSCHSSHTLRERNAKR